MPATDKIKNKTKLFQSTQNSALTFSNNKIYLVFLTNSYANHFFFYFSNFIIKTVKKIPQY